MPPDTQNDTVSGSEYRRLVLQSIQELSHVNQAHETKIHSHDLQIAALERAEQNRQAREEKAANRRTWLTRLLLAGLITTILSLLGRLLWDLYHFGHV